MTDITETRLREIAEADLLSLAMCARMGELSWSDVRSSARELLAARARITQLEQQPPMQLVDIAHGLDLQGIRDDLKFLDDVRLENKRLREQLHADDERAWEALGKPEGAFETTHVERLCAEVERLRLAIRFGGCSSLHAAELRDAGGAWAVDAIAERDGLQAANDRLRGLIREYFDAKYEYVSFRDAEKNRRYETAEDALASEAKEPKP